MICGSKRIFIGYMNAITNSTPKNRSRPTNWRGRAAARAETSMAVLLKYHRIFKLQLPSMCNCNPLLQPRSLAAYPTHRPLAASAAPFLPCRAVTHCCPWNLLKPSEMEVTGRRSQPKPLTPLVINTTGDTVAPSLPRHTARSTTTLRRRSSPPATQRQPILAPCSACR
jgi:hypothetical protein